MLVLPADAPEQAPRLAWQIHQPMNPASVMKLVTTLAALDLLGPAYTWQTPVYLDGTLQGGVLRGNVYVQGQGDPQLVAERLWLLLQRLQAQGVQAIEGDIVLDRSAFQLGAHDPAAFDGEPLRPYNAAPDALLINYQTLTLSFVPDVAAGVARIAWLPPLAQWSAPESVPLAEPGTPCGEWQQALQPLRRPDPARAAAPAPGRALPGGVWRAPVVGGRGAATIRRARRRRDVACCGGAPERSGA